ncbi:hypothetical protein, partial [Pseudovibrio flavus]|uniref:hypothetical protein n=1 Tax=Pseudovibrio flavus TaxID=2529854 RepID=UPI00211CEF47
TSSTNEKAHAVTAGNNAGFVSSMDATLFAATDGLASFLAAAPAADGLVTFGATGGRSTSYDNGQNIDLEGFNFMVGAGATREIGGGEFHLAGFAETGKQTYDASSHLVSGKGNVDFMGGGVMAHVVLSNGLYAEGLVRAGMADMAYDTKDFATPVSYDFSSAYVGGYAGLGYNTEVCDGVSWGLHGKYIYS